MSPAGEPSADAAGTALAESFGKMTAFPVDGLFMQLINMSTCRIPIELHLESVVNGDGERNNGVLDHEGVVGQRTHIVLWSSPDQREHVVAASGCRRSQHEITFAELLQTNTLAPGVALSSGAATPLACVDQLGVHSIEHHPDILLAALRLTVNPLDGCVHRLALMQDAMELCSTW
ncbi:unnamed protein product [Phytophthora fragariaefolia]|uniref:Unnamed protein product n=1 Tax=Phytophthora fragariaefolia TaxID=1490495 RepID=A0A9W6UFD9_9STRA|nr:unnamed protein product [Phytophthora fragariaefolia]